MHGCGRSHSVRSLVVVVLLLGVGCSGVQDETGIRGCPRPEWPGPWTACAEARWVERVVEAGGYDVNGGTGSALTAVGRGRAFYIWASSTGADDSEPADEGVRTTWSAQGFTFWVETGPRVADAKPTIDELESVVAASRQIAPPAEQASVPFQETRMSPAVTATAEGRQVLGCPRVRLAWGNRVALAKFFPPSLAGLWLRQDHCVYLVFPAREEARALWRAPAGERVHGLSWAPDGQTFALAAGSRVVLLGRDGSPLRRLRGTGAAFLRDGRLALSRTDGIHLLTGSRSRRLASRRELERVAGFRARRTFSVSHDPWGFIRGHGRGAVAITLWSAGSSWKSVVLVVTTVGRVVRASPAYRAGGGEGVVSGWAWSPDGRKLFVAAEVAGPPERRRAGKHDHCLDVWSAEVGHRRAFCESQLPPPHHLHFAKLAWATDGKTALLDTGTLFTRDGGVAGRVPVAPDDLSFRVQWESHGR